MDMFPKDMSKCIYGKGTLKPRALNLHMNTLPSVLKRRAGTSPFPLTFVGIYECITAVVHRDQKRACMGFLLECRYQSAAEKQ